jgi:hypothetical protein
MISFRGRVTQRHSAMHTGPARGQSSASDRQPARRQTALSLSDAQSRGHPPPEAPHRRAPPPWLPPAASRFGQRPTPQCPTPSRPRISSPRPGLRRSIPLDRHHQTRNTRVRGVGFPGHPRTSSCWNRHSRCRRRPRSSFLTGQNDRAMPCAPSDWAPIISLPSRFGPELLTITIDRRLRLYDLPAGGAGGDCVCPIV